MKETLIEWTNVTWNPVRGYSMVSPGCAHCYAARIAARFSGRGKPYEGLALITPSGPQWTGEVVCVDSMLHEPLRGKKPCRIFVNSMSDLFHELVPFDSLCRVFEIMQGTHWHTFQILTKRSNRLRELSRYLPWPSNVWMSVSVENNDVLNRIDDLRKTPAKLKFLSLELTA